MCPPEISILLWLFLALNIQVHDNWTCDIFTYVLSNSWRTTSLNALVFNGEFYSARLPNPHSCLRVLRLSDIHVHRRIFTLGEWISSLSCWKNWPIMQGMRGGQHLLFQVFVLHHTVVCEFMTAFIKHNSCTPSALIHPYIKLYNHWTSLWVPTRAGRYGPKHYHDNYFHISRYR